MFNSNPNLGTGPQRGGYLMGLAHNGNGTQWDWDTIVYDRICPFADSDRFSPTGVELSMQASRYHRITAKSAELMRRICTIQSTFSLITVPRAEGGGGLSTIIPLPSRKHLWRKSSVAGIVPFKTKQKRKKERKKINPLCVLNLQHDPQSKIPCC